ncbi:hypothetical protein [Hydrogenophaga sp. BPS33]|uniref:hypothetical protein n=1 Tax=Hydrogenophaga sp. BPS33 TaxID=2651974 RepID=UPI00135AFFCD|nr:hypothetical protein [Hydrogenophaga sp. BPS33]
MKESIRVNRRIACAQASARMPTGLTPILPVDDRRNHPATLTQPSTWGMDGIA